MAAPLLAQKMARAFRFVIMDAARTDADHVIELNAPEEKLARALG